MKRLQPLVALALNQLIDGGEFSRIFPIFVAGAIFAILSQQYICGKSGSTVLQALRILAEPVAGRLQITHLQLPESKSLIFCVIVMLNIVLALQASRLHTSYCKRADRCCVCPFQWEVPIAVPILILFLSPLSPVAIITKTILCHPAVSIQIPL